MIAPLRHGIRRREAGFSLVETLIVIVIVGLLTLLAMPRIDVALTRRDIASAKSGLTNLVLRAKVAAVSARRATTINVTSSSAYATLVTVGGTTQNVGGALFFETGVTASYSASTLVVQPTGLITSGTPFTVVFSKRGVTDSVMVVGYGRVQ
jgi:prepilin-type N-terminal cleavage/methylation domain-containing protein